MVLEDIVIECYSILFREFRPGINVISRDRGALLMLLQKLVYVDNSPTDLDRIFVVSLLLSIRRGLVLIDRRSSRRLSLWHVGDFEERFSLSVRV